MRLVSQSPLLNMLQKTAIGYDAPSNLTYAWSFGIFSMLTLGIQFISGIFLSMHYIPEINYAFNSIEHIMRDVNGGWLFRYLHSNGASFFLFVYTYICYARYGMAPLYIQGQNYGIYVY